MFQSSSLFVPMAIAITLTISTVSTTIAVPNSHSSAGGNGNGKGGGNAGGPAVHEYVVANGLKQGDVSSSLKSWNSLNANSKAFLNNLGNPNSLLGKEATYICDNAQTQTDLAGFVTAGGDPSAPPSQDDYDAAIALLAGANPDSILADPASTPEQVAAANTIIQFNDWTAYQASAAKADTSFAAASVSYGDGADLSHVRTLVDTIVEQKSLAGLCSTKTAAAQ